MTLLDVLNTHNWNTVEVTDKEVRHKYCSEVYDEIFLTFKSKRIRFLEIGIFRGGSLALFHEYFKNGDIYGVDNTDYGAMRNCTPFSRIKIMYTDAYNEHFVKVLPEFDIIIDDGPHTKDSQRFFIKHYLPLVTTGGMLIVEDIPDIQWTEEFSKLVPESMSYRTIDLRPKTKTSDSILFIVNK